MCIWAYVPGNAVSVCAVSAWNAQCPRQGNCITADEKKKSKRYCPGAPSLISLYSQAKNKKHLQEQKVFLCLYICLNYYRKVAQYSVKILYLCLAFHCKTCIVFVSRCLEGGRRTSVRGWNRETNAMLFESCEWKQCLLC